jgi:site-specific DNA recombinase
MPKPKEIAARYIRESDPTLADSTTIDSQAKLVLQHCQKEGYLTPPEYEFREAVSAYNTPHLERKELIKLLDVVKKGLVNVVVISEVRALSRKQVEIFVIYNLLQKYHCRLETVVEKFEDSTMGRLILSLRAAFSEIERDQTYLRLQRGKHDRLLDGAPNGHPKPAYGYRFYNTAQEIKAGYEINDTIIYIDATGKEWSEHTVCLYIFDMFRQKLSLNKMAYHLNDLGIPPPRKATKHVPHWSSSTLYRMFSNRIYIGEVWCNRYKKVGKQMVKRPREEWVLLSNAAPAMIDKETFELVQAQFAANREDSVRNNKHTTELGLLRSGYIYCGICGCKMSVIYPTPTMIKNKQLPLYRCQQKEGANHAQNHNNSIALSVIDNVAWEKVRTVLRNSDLVRERVNELRKQPVDPVDLDVIEQTLVSIREEIDNLFELARHATSKTTIDRLGLIMEDLEKRYRNTEALLIDIEESKEEYEEVEAEIVKFETWIANVRDLLLNDDYQPTYEEKRLAIRIIGIRVTVFPLKGDYPYRYSIEVMIPAIAGKIALQSRLE